MHQWMTKRWFHILIIWPSLNLFMVSQIVYWLKPELYQLDPALFLRAMAAQVYSTAFVFYLAVSLVERFVLVKKMIKMSIIRAFIYIILLLFSFFIVSYIWGSPAFFSNHWPVVFPILNLSLQAVLYVLILAMFKAKNLQFKSKLYAREMELQMLRSQSAPHFIFNTLNLIANVTVKQPQLAQELIYDLSDLLRKNTLFVEQGEITIAKELELINHYLKLQQKRFSDRLSYSVYVDESVKDIKIPALIILPLVENAIKYGVAPFKHPKPIEISIIEKLTNIEIKVQNKGNYKITELDKANASGMGFNIINKTLEIYYQSKPRVEFLPSKYGNLTMIQLPKVN